MCIYSYNYLYNAVALFLQIELGLMFFSVQFLCYTNALLLCSSTNTHFTLPPIKFRFNSVYNLLFGLLYFETHLSNDFSLKTI